jgi:hypothetical protein
MRGLQLQEGIERRQSLSRLFASLRTSPAAAPVGPLVSSALVLVLAALMLQLPEGDEESV